MRNKVITALVLTSLFCVSCAHDTADIHAESSASAKYNLSELKTYAWWGAVGELYDPNGRWVPTNMDAASEIKWLIDRELRKRGYTEVSQDPELLVTFAVVVDMEALALVKSHADGSLKVANIPQGALMVELLDSETENIVWLGSADAEIRQYADEDIVKKRLDVAISGMFKGLPK